MTSSLTMRSPIARCLMIMRFVRPTNVQQCRCGHTPAIPVTNLLFSFCSEPRDSGTYKLAVVDGIMTITSSSTSKYQWVLLRYLCVDAIQGSRCEERPPWKKGPKIIFLSMGTRTVIRWSVIPYKEVNVGSQKRVKHWPGAGIPWGWNGSWRAWAMLGSSCKVEGRCCRHRCLILPLPDEAVRRRANGWPTQHLTLAE